MQLGSLKKDARTGEFNGGFKTASFIVEDLTMVPAQKPEGVEGDYPDYEIFAATGAKFGAAWKRTARSTGQSYLSARLLDPTFNNGQAFYFAMFEQKDGGLSIVWNPSNPEKILEPSRPAATVDADAPRPALGGSRRK